MEIKVLWSDRSLSQLEDIFDYYSDTAGKRIAKKLVKRIISKTIRLEKNPLIGSKEILLDSREFEYRYLVEGNYKIIYRFNNQIVRIVSIFDCRQNPIKMENINDERLP